MNISNNNEDQDLVYLRSLTILYVEDEEDIRNQLMLFLKRRCQKVYTAANGQQGLEAFQKHQPDIVITDILMPIMDGLKLAEHIKAARPNIPIIIITAFEEPRYFHRAIELKVHQYVNKPVKLNILQDALITSAHILRVEAALEAEIVNQKRLESSLRDSESRLRDSILSSPNPIMIHAENGEVLMLSNAWTAITGYRQEDIPTTKHWIEKAFGVKAKILTAHFNEQYGLQEVRKEGEYEIRTASGDSRVWNFQSQPLRKLPDGRRVVLSQATDITEHKQAELESQILAAIIRSSDDAIISMDINGMVSSWNISSEHMFGYTAQEMIGKSILKLSPPQRAHEETYILGEIALGKRIEHFETVRICKNGLPIDVSVTISPIFDGTGKIVGASKISRDITARKQTENMLRIAAIAFESQEGMTVTDAEGTILRVNQAFTNITGYAAHDVIGKNPRLLKSGRQDANFYAAMWESILHTGVWEGEIWNRRKNGEIYPEYLTITAVKNNLGMTTNYVATLSDITLKKEAEDEIKHLAFYDPLTRLPNRRLLRDRLQKTLTSIKRSGLTCGLLFIDLDNFKTLNDTLGHDIGDLLLQQVSERLKTCIREGDTVARLGGDEFVIMLENLNKNNILAAELTKMVGNKILDTLNQPYQLAIHKHTNTPSIGATLFNDNRYTIDELMKQADIAMYQSKKAGRNTMRFFDPRMQNIVNIRASLESELRNAIENQQFCLYYQIQVDGIQKDGSRRLPGAEALIRWLHPVRGLMLPGEFISLAEETGLILPIGQWVLDTACAQIHAWQQDKPNSNFTLAINISAKQFRQPDFIGQIQSAIQNHAIKPMCLKLELTESLLLENIEDTIITMNALNKIGVQFSLDDFGTGYSSLQYLKRLPLHQLKIDQSFVRDIAFDSNDKAIVCAIIAMANSLNIDVIAEGVETEDQLKFLLENGCTGYQGYLFGKPAPIEQFKLLLKHS